MIFNLIDAMYPQAGPAPTPEKVLYYSGNEQTSVTGGWEAFAPAWVGSGSYCYVTPSGGSLIYGTNPIKQGSSSTYVKESGDLKVYFRAYNGSDQWVNTGFSTVNRIDLTNWNTLHIQALVATHTSSPAVNSAYRVFGVTPSKTPPADGSTTPPGNYKTINSGETTLDISNVTGEQFIYFGGSLKTNALDSSTSRYMSIGIVKIWLT